MTGKPRQPKTPQVPKFRYFRCEDTAFELLKAYQNELELLSSNHVKLHMEFQERAEAMQQHHQSNLRSMWARLSAMVGLDPEKTWGNPEYQIEARYLKDGFGAILFIPQPRGTALQELLGGAPELIEEDDLTQETAPDKTRLN